MPPMVKLRRIITGSQRQRQPPALLPWCERCLNARCRPNLLHRDIEATTVFRFINGIHAPIMVTPNQPTALAFRSSAQFSAV
ncbi:hypothetical protein ACNKHK_00175 [Shigella flexneri]